MCCHVLIAYCCDRLKLPNYVKIGMLKFFFPPLTLNKQTNMILPFSIQITQQSNIKQQRVNLRLYHVQYKSSCHLHHFIVTYDFNGHFCACPGLVSTSYYITEHTMACIPIHCITLVQHLSYTHSYRTKMYDHTIRTRNQKSNNYKYIKAIKYCIDSLLYSALVSNLFDRPIK